MAQCGFRCPRGLLPLVHPSPVRFRCPRSLCRFQDCPTITCAYCHTTCVSQPPVHIRIPPVLRFSVSHVRTTVADSSLCRFQMFRNITCADSDDPEPVQIPVIANPTATYADISPQNLCRLYMYREPVQIPVSRPTATPMQILHACRTCADSVPTSTQSPVQILHASEPVLNSSVTVSPQSPVQSLLEPMQLLPVLDPHVGPFGVDSMHSTSSCRLYLDPKNSSCFTRYPLFLMEISSPSWMKGSPMDLTMPRLNSVSKISV
ncbi:hypothetical protein TNCV_5137451 [Trichonephila clavipes]|nr:hypothetical protein TNCV_5137451 [Trichonephila clavipes]